MGALPVCDGNILQSLAGPCPVLRRGRCLHRPGSPAMPQGLRGGRERPPYIAAGNGRRRESGSQSPSLATGRCSHRPGTPAMPQGPAAGVNARPTLRPGTGGDAEAVVRRQARPRADASIGPYAGGGAGLGGRCQAPPPRRGTSRRRRLAAPGAHRPAKRIVSLCAKDQPAADIAQPKSPLNARWARSFGPARRTPPPSGGGPGCRTPACGRR